MLSLHTKTYFGFNTIYCIRKSSCYNINTSDNDIVISIYMW